MRVIELRLEEIDTLFGKRSYLPMILNLPGEETFYIVCIRKDLEKPTAFNFPSEMKVNLDIRDVLDKGT